MTKKHIRYASEHQAELGKLLRGLAPRYRLWEVFRDAMAIWALTISNAVDKSQFDVREAEYMRIIKRYDKEELLKFAEGLTHVVFGLEGGMDDFLGSLFMMLELGDAWRGQFFTPYEVSKLMATLTIGDATHEAIKQQGFFTLNDPCVGGGAFIIASAEVALDQKINYQQRMHVIAQDIDITAVHMAYIQFSLLHIPAVVYHGNSLTMNMTSAWRTPAHVLGRWDARLRAAGDSSTLTVPKQPHANDDRVSKPSPGPAVPNEEEPRMQMHLW